MIDYIKRKSPTKVTIANVAEKAGVGVATVDRVINGRSNVSVKTIKKVLEAAQQLGYHGTNLIKQRLNEEQDETKLGFILQKRESEFFCELEKSLKSVCLGISSQKVTPIVEFLEDLTPKSVAKALEEMSHKADAIALVGANHQTVNLTIEDIQAKGTPVFTLISDLSAQNRAGYVGIDNHAAGRSAAWAITSLSKVKGKIGVILGSHRYLCQEQSEASFRSYCRENAPDFEIIDAVISLENQNLAEESTLELLQANPDIVGLYCTGGGVEGVISVLSELPNAQDIVVVVNELTDTTRRALIEGVVNLVISHPRKAVAQKLVSRMLDPKTPLIGRPDDVCLPFDICIKENV